MHIVYYIVYMYPGGQRRGEGEVAGSRVCTTEPKSG